MKLRNKKTGDAVYVDFQIPLSNNDKVLGAYSVTSLKELNESFEDYAPKEPLIKDEKIRKAVRAWAEANNFKPYAKIVYGCGEYDGISITWLREEETNREIHFPLCNIGDDGENTIEELCGEEES